MTLKDFFKVSKIDCNEFTDRELSVIIHQAFWEGLYSVNELEGYRHTEFHCMTYSEPLNKLAKCTDWRVNRVMVNREEFLNLFPNIRVKGRI